MLSHESPQEKGGEKEEEEGQERTKHLHLIQKKHKNKKLENLSGRLRKAYVRQSYSYEKDEVGL